MGDGPARWQLVVAVVGLLVVVVLGVLLASGGGHGPGRHAPAGGTATSPADAPDDLAPAEHAPPAGEHG